MSIDGTTFGERLGLSEFLSLGTKLGSIVAGAHVGTVDGLLLAEMVGVIEGSLGNSTGVVDGTGLPRINDGLMLGPGLT